MFSTLVVMSGHGAAAQVGLPLCCKDRVLATLLSATFRASFMAFTSANRLALPSPSVAPTAHQVGLLAAAFDGCLQHDRTHR